MGKVVWIFSSVAICQILVPEIIGTLSLSGCLDLTQVLLSLVGFYNMRFSYYEINEVRAGQGELD